MPELFVELLSEEIPARMQRRAAENLKRLVTQHLVDAGLVYEGARTAVTPRRLALSVQGLPARSNDKVEERRGPRVGAPDKAIEGFVRAAGLSSIEEAEVVADKKGDIYLARRIVPGREAIAVCGEAIADTVRHFPWPVTMRWGAASADAGALRWVRPLTAIVATFGAENEDPDIVPVDLPVPVGDVTFGHRLHAPGLIRVRRWDDYEASLAAAHVVVSHDRRRDQILHDARDRAFALGLTLVEDDALIDEVAGLVEWPVVHVGRFDAVALDLPDEVIRLTIRENQKCFVTRDGEGRLSNAFVLTANLEAKDAGAAIVAGNERVVRARLADARFFYDQDRLKPLAVHAEALAAVTFHDKLGTQAARVARIATLARWLAPKVGADPDLAFQAAQLSKADLPTLMVGEFPELQGYVGRRYAEAEGLPAEVAAAIEEHYRPLGPADDVPTAPVTVAVALADKFDSLVGLWIAGEKPTGSGDAYGLRRAALGIIRVLLETGTRLRLSHADGPFVQAVFGMRDTPAYKAAMAELGGEDVDETVERVAAVLFATKQQTFLLDQVDFALDRLIVQQRDAGTAADTVRAILPVVRAGTIDLVDIVNRIAALKAFLATDDGANLMAGYKRATNILKAEEKKDGAPAAGPVDGALLREPEEQALGAAIDQAKASVADAVAAEDYQAAMARLAAVRPAVDAFFDKVLVNADEPDVRANRLRLLAALRDTTRTVADFSEIAG